MNPTKLPAPVRHLDWEGCCNVRDLGGLRTLEGRETRSHALVRADALDHLTESGWDALWAHGVRTIIDLRNDDEIACDLTPRPDGVATLHLPHDCSEDSEFWDVWASGPQFGSPLYYGPHLTRFPERSARVVSAVARAAPGGVVVHCGIGRDRTGMLSALLLALVGVVPELIAADYELSADRLRSHWARRGEPDQGAMIEAFLQRKGLSASQIIVRLVSSAETRAALSAGGVDAHDLARLRARLLG
jgi:protein-tyrosine phosphatase